MKKYKVLLVGAGYMAEEYVKVLNHLKIDFDLVGNGKKKVKILEKIYNRKFFWGGIEKFNFKTQYTHCAICVNEKKIFKVVRSIAKTNIKNILVEKPGGDNLSEIQKINKLSKLKNLKIYIGYNRRFYETILFLKKKIVQDKGIISANFSFTEWTDKILKLKYENDIYRKWFYFNSLHILDLVFYLIGWPKKINCLSGKNLSPFTKSTFVGSGITKKNIFFSYHSNWNSAGRWSINIYTKKNRIILSPLEKVLIQKKNHIVVEEKKFKKKYDDKFKPGIGYMLEAFIIKKNKKSLQTYEDYAKNFFYYEKISSFPFK
jgi:hypothetical protein